MEGCNNISENCIRDAGPWTPHRQRASPQRMHVSGHFLKVTLRASCSHRRVQREYVAFRRCSDSAEKSYNIVAQFPAVQRSHRTFLHCQIQPVYFVNNQRCLKFSEQHMFLCHCQSAVVDVNRWRCVAGTFFFDAHQD